MGKSDHTSFQEEAETCRRRALAYIGQPEATFLVRAAEEFERLDGEQRGHFVHSRPAPKP